MQLCKVLHKKRVRVGIVDGDSIRLLPRTGKGGLSFSDALGLTPKKLTKLTKTGRKISLEKAKFLAPMDEHEVWAAGVTYKRSEEARKEESAGAAQFYDKVYKADRPELFFKATPHRVVGHGGSIRIRQDAKWNVPEPELGLVLSPKLELQGFTVGNDVSSRDIEGENPLYLPQAKVYDQCCALGPWVTLSPAIEAPEQLKIQLIITRAEKVVFQDETSTSKITRKFSDLIAWLGRDNSFPNGVILLTGTGIVPPNDFTLEAEDLVHIHIEKIGTLTNKVVRG